MERFVVVAEPHDYLRGMLCTYLASHGYRTGAAATVEEVQALVTREPPDVVLADRELPIAELLVTVRAAGLATRILVMTAASVASGDALARELGVHAVIAKPFVPSALVDLVRMHAGVRKGIVDRKLVAVDGITYDVRPMPGVLDAFEVWRDEEDIGFFVLDDAGHLDVRRSSAPTLTAARLAAIAAFF